MLLKVLNGYKTYLLCFAAFVLWLGIVFGWWSWEEVDRLFGLLGVLGVATGRSAVKKMERVRI